MSQEAVCRGASRGGRGDVPRPPAPGVSLAACLLETDMEAPHVLWDKQTQKTKQFRQATEMVIGIQGDNRGAP